MTESNLMPVYFISHGGGPCFFMDWSSIGPADTWKAMEDFLRAIPSSLPEKPKAIVLISAHWEEAEFTIQKNSSPDLIYDYSGFPPHTYQLKYPASGDVTLAERIGALLQSSGIPFRYDEKRGFDHGVFIPMLLVFPEADVPIIQISLKKGLDPSEHLALGHALEPLRSEGVLIIGSGMSYHNLRALFSGVPDVAGSIDFDRWLQQSVVGTHEGEREVRLKHWMDAPAARIAHPREEHLLPLMVASGAGNAGISECVFRDKIMGAWNSSFKFS
jgi:aromatic ring-opening dioxygenase catalytic subunit (LigB family)